MATKSDVQINQDVFDALTWDPAIQVADLNIDTFDGAVRLTGKVRNYGTKEEATAAAYRVSGVQYVHNEMVVDPWEPDIRSDTSLTDSIKLALSLDSRVPDQRITVQVSRGHVTLTGSLDWAYQRCGYGTPGNIP